MELQLKNGDYVPDGRGGFCHLEGEQEVLRRVVFRLKARRGGLPFLPNLGSQLYLLPREKPSARKAVALRYVTQALEEETEVAVRDVEVAEKGQGELELTVWLDWKGETLTARLTI